MIKSCEEFERFQDDDNNKEFIRDPFSDRPMEVKRVMMRQTKRTQRYRSTARSRICGMTVGDIRYCFQQLRSAGSALSPQLVLYNGQCAGEFALSYLIETSNSMRKRRKKKRQAESEKDDVVNDNNQVLPRSQLSTKRPQASSRYVIEF